MACDCLKRVNQGLQEGYPGVYLQEMTNLETREKAIIPAVERRHGSSRKKLPALIVRFCPFCGVEYGDNDEAQSAEQEGAQP